MTADLAILTSWTPCFDFTSQYSASPIRTATNAKSGSVGPYEIREISPDGERLVTVPENPDFEEVGRGLLC
jgi:hypothetical protein